jgi:hypothetical protein
MVFTVLCIVGCADRCQSRGNKDVAFLTFDVHAHVGELLAKAVEKAAVAADKESPGHFLGEGHVQRLLDLCHVQTEIELPVYWHRLAADGAKNGCQTLDAAVRKPPGECFSWSAFPTINNSTVCSSPGYYLRAVELLTGRASKN